MYILFRRRKKNIFSWKLRLFLKDIFYKRYCLTMLPSNYTSKSWNTCHNVTYLPVICFVFKNSTDLKTKNSTKSSTLFCHLSLSLYVSIWICTPLKTQRFFFWESQVLMFYSFAIFKETRPKKCWNLILSVKLSIFIVI